MEEKITETPVPQKNTTTDNQRMYPELIIPNNANPDKLYAFPVVGLLIKLILIIPVAIVYFLIGFCYNILMLITPFVILFTGKYWDTAYKWAVGFYTYGLKTRLFLAGVTDKYPGFSMDSNGIFELHLAKPQSPSRLKAFPLLGYIARLLVMIPYIFYQTILAYGQYGAIVASWFGVWIKGRYPESLYEFIKDSSRVSIAYDAYMAYLSDTYPSFKISMNHKKVKIILLIIGTLLTLIDLTNQINQQLHSNTNSMYSNTTNNTTPDSTQYNYPTPTPNNP